MDDILPGVSKFKVGDPFYTVKQMKSIIKYIKGNDNLLQNGKLKEKNCFPLTFFSLTLNEVLEILQFLIPLQEEYERLMKIENELR